LPSSAIDPARVGKMPIIAFIRVVLPIPLRPMTARTSPSAALSERLLMTSLSP